MKKSALLIIPILLSAFVCVAGYFSVKYAIQLPFRSTNDTLHKKNSPITMDFLIPGGTYLDEKMTIGEVIRLRFKKETSMFNRSLKVISEMIPARYRYLADLVLLFFWSFLYMTFLRIFTFMGYARALRVSLFLGGCTYFFMPDFSPGKVDDILFIAIPVSIMLLRGLIKRSAKRAKRLQVQE
jgi:hypothetical protein